MYHFWNVTLSIIFKKLSFSTGIEEGEILEEEEEEASTRESRVFIFVFLSSKYLFLLLNQEL